MKINILIPFWMKVLKQLCKERGGMTATTLHRKKFSCFSNPYVLSTIKELGKKGYLTQKYRGSSKRDKSIRLTPKGAFVGEFLKRFEEFER